MKYNQIGKTDVEVSEVSLGCWTMGGLNWVDGQANGWANVDEDEITAAVKVAVEAGVNHFDNADVYGNGSAERMLKRVLKKLGLKSEDFVITSKMGHFKGTAEHAYDPLHIRHQCEQSLKNLGRDYIDIYYLHHGNFGINDEYLEGAADVLNQLKQEGKIRVKGQSAYSFKDFEKAVPVVQPSVLQSWAHALDYKFIEPKAVTGRLLEKHGMSFVAFSPLAQGRLLDKFDPKNPPQFEPGDHRIKNPAFAADAIRSLKPKLQRLKERFGDTTEALSGMAQRFVLSHPNVACTIPGFRNERQVRCNLHAKDVFLNQEEIKFIKSTLN